MVVSSATLPEYDCSCCRSTVSCLCAIPIERAGPSPRKKFFEFLTVPIRNAHTRAAYYRAIQQFLAWSERAGYQALEDIEPITVAAQGQTAHGRHPDAVLLADRKRSASHERACLIKPHLQRGKRR